MQIDRKGRTLIVRITGDLDHENATAVKAKLTKEWQREVAQNYLFILSGLNFMDSSGLGLLMGRYREAKDRGGKTAIAGLIPQAERIMQLAGILKIIPVFPDVAEALKYLER